MKEDSKTFNFEENIQRLETIVKELESGNVPLDDALTKFNEAFTISKLCDARLKEVSESVNKILTKDGNLEDFNVEE